jgi:hypothetical protein
VPLDTPAAGASPQPPSMSLLHDLLDKVSSAAVGSAELDKDIIAAFPTASNGITKSIDAAVQLIKAELPGWWWVCGFCTLSNDASIEVPRARAGPDFRAGPEPMRPLTHPRMGHIFDKGFHRDRRGGTVPLAMLEVFLQAKLALAELEASCAARSAPALSRPGRRRGETPGASAARRKRRRRLSACAPRLLRG